MYFTAPIPFRGSSSPAFLEIDGVQDRVTSHVCFKDSWPAHCVSWESTEINGLCRSVKMVDALPFRKPHRQESRQMSTDPHNELKVHMDHYIGIDVGTGSARACIINAKGDIVGLASENIGLWQPEQGYYVRLSTVTSCLLIWFSVHRAPHPSVQNFEIVGSWRIMLIGLVGTIYYGYLAVHLHCRSTCHESAQHRSFDDSRHWLRCNMLSHSLQRRNRSTGIGEWT